MSPRPEHSLRTILADMEQSATDLENDISALETESDQMLQSIRSMIGDLSDLRYGRFNHTNAIGKDLGEEVLESLEMLEKTATQAR